MTTFNNRNLSFEIAKNVEVITQIEPVVTHAVENILVNSEDCWQPSDFLPDMSKGEAAIDEVRALQARSAGLPDEVIVSLIGNMITEEALPNYQTFFQLIEGINDERNFTSDKGWVRWSRAWTAEENRHGDLLNKYLYLSGRANMKDVEITIHNLITNGFDANTDHCPYQTMVYTSFQERATKVSHVNTGKLADKAGDEVLSRICKTIAGDEARHEKAYKSFMSKVFEIDPNGGIIAFEKMMRKQITMPAVMMGKDANDDVFTRFSTITQKVGIYTAWDYAKIIQHLVDLWKIEGLTGLDAVGQKAQNYLVGLADRYMRVADRMKAPQEVSLLWLSV
jgi:acyl-[acyl-carrier-protein] desaturase